jgi:folate-dependent phosphoribosylglycinamide formyltransferase PurN
MRPIYFPGGNNVRIALLTNGLRPIAQGFPSFPGEPVGIINWDDSFVEVPTWKYALQTSAARIRRRPYGSLRHLCQHRKLEYAEISQNNPQQLKRVLHDWRVDLVITSGCPIVPMDALEDIEHGGINLHPSLLPAYRGGNPFFWQAYDCVKNTGCSVHTLTASTDKGDLLGQTQIKREDGWDRHAWLHFTEAKAGIPLLKKVVKKIMAGTLQRDAQPDASPTRYTKNFKASKLREIINPDEMSVYSLWNILCFYETCPESLGKISGWRCWFRWIPSYRLARREKQGHGLTACAMGVHWLLEIPAGTITLTPRFSSRHILNKMRNRSNEAL